MSVSEPNGEVLRIVIRVATSPGFDSASKTSCKVGVTPVPKGTQLFTVSA